VGEVTLFRRRMKVAGRGKIEVQYQNGRCVVIATMVVDSHRISVLAGNLQDASS
jgi:hypothetical protein